MSGDSLGGFPAGAQAWVRLCRRARELLGAPSAPSGWCETPEGPVYEVERPTLWGRVCATFHGDTLVEICWDDAPVSPGANRTWPSSWRVGWVKGTDFERSVWAACLEAEDVITYSGLAEQAGSPKAARAVGSALSRNPLAPLVPCHWPGPASGALGGFSCGPDRKAAWRRWERGVGV